MEKQRLKYVVLERKHDNLGRFIKGVKYVIPKIKCLQCGKLFHMKPHVIRIGKGKYCSKKCYYKGKKGTIPIQFVNKAISFKKGYIPWNKGLGMTEEEKRLSQRVHANNRRMKIKNLEKATVQLVYEDNIKTHGTLTCYLCCKPIKFGEDALEHKTPLCRGGSNDYCNLDVAHGKCNSSKGKKTYEEWKESITI